MRGDRKRWREFGEADSARQGADSRVIDVKSYKPKHIPSLLWRACIKKVWEVDPLICQKCAGEMRVIWVEWNRSSAGRTRKRGKVIER